MRPGVLGPSMWKRTLFVVTPRAMFFVAQVTTSDHFFTGFRSRSWKS